MAVFALIRFANRVRSVMGLKHDLRVVQHDLFCESGRRREGIRVKPDLLHKSGELRQQIRFLHDLRMVILLVVSRIACKSGAP